MTQRSRSRLWLVALVASGLLVALPGIAVAQADSATAGPTTTGDVRPSDDFGEIQQRALHAVERRLKTVARLAHRVEASDTVGEEHAAKLLRDLRDAAGGLEELGRKIKAAETIAELRELVPMIGAFKIYQLVKPKVNEVLASDRIVAKARHLYEFSEKLEKLILRAEEAGYDVERPLYLLKRMRRHLEAAAAKAGPVADMVVDLQPEDWPDPAKGLLAKGARRLHVARDHIHVAKHKARRIVHWLRNLSDPPIDLSELG